MDVLDLLTELEKYGKTIKIVDKEDEATTNSQNLYDSYVTIKITEGLLISYDLKNNIHSLTQNDKTNPAIMSYYDNKNLNKHMEVWMYHGELHSYNDEPAIIIYNIDGSIRRKIWLKYNKFYNRGENYNYVSYLDDGIYKKWFEDCKTFANSKYTGSYDYRNDIKKKISRLLIDKENLLHRELNEGPAFIYTSKEGTEIQRVYYMHGECIRVYDRYCE